MMDTAARLCVVRHGETDWNRAGILQGWRDVPLNAQGREQAQSLGDSFLQAGFAAVWTSPLRRAQETAEIVATRLGLTATFGHDGLKERHFGAIQGVPKAELAEHNPLLLQQILSRNPAAEFVGGETMDEFADRVLTAVAAIGARHRGERALIVTHGWVMDVITRHVSRLARHAILDLKRKNGESLWLEVSGEMIRAGD